MTLSDPRDLQKLTLSFDSLFAALRDDLDWPIEWGDISSDATFEYDANELAIAPRYAAHIKTIKQLRPLIDKQVWGIFFIEFDQNRLPVMALRRILAALAENRRHRSDALPVWKRDDLLFLCQYTSASEGKAGQRSITFAYFHTSAEGKPELRTFSWDSRETHFYYLRRENLEALRSPQEERDTEAWRKQWRSAFITPHRYTIRTTEKLASHMATQARVIRELIDDLYEAEGDNGALHKLFHRLQIDLIHDLQPETFGDMIAQTITYGIFSAAEKHGTVSLDTLADTIPDTNPLLKSMLTMLTTEGKLDLEELGIGQLVDVLRQTDIKAITHDFGRQTGNGKEDPVIHFYEQFLTEYDREQRVQRGVFYTPDPVVQYIVKAVDQILQRPLDQGGFGIAEGLASDAVIDPVRAQPLVQILDPATGTGTFLAHIIDHIKAAKKDLTPAQWNAYVATNLLKRLNGFELMMAPYTIAHLKLGLKLAETGYTFGTGERLRVFLTNALEEPVQMQETLLNTDFLSREANEAAIVKQKAPIMVVIGNPPYSGVSANINLGDWFGHQDYFQVDGQSLGERNPKWLHNDYIKFIRFGQWRIEKSGEGILAFITDNSYLDSPTMRGMRQNLMNTFDEIYILNLHGNSNKQEANPSGGKDENVFEIQQGVVISIFVKHSSSEQTKRPARIFHRDLWGIRKFKYDSLLEGDAVGTSSDWKEIFPISPFYVYFPYDNEPIEYRLGWKIVNILPTNGWGIATRKDYLLVDISREVLVKRFQDIQQLTPEMAIKKYSITTAPHWNFVQAHAALSPDTAKHVRKILFRPFDIRYVYYEKHMIERGDHRYDLMQHMFRKNLSLITIRRAETQNSGVHFYCSNELSVLHSTSSKEGNFVFPLYLYPTDGEKFDDKEKDWPRTNGRRPNLSKAFVAQMTGKLGLSFITDGRGDLHHTFGPEDVFHYAYAVFHSPTYRTRYAEQLKIDFPRLPLTTDIELFRQLVMRGVDLVALHLLEGEYQGTYWQRHHEASPLTQSITTFVSGFNKNTVGAMSKSAAYDETQKRVYLDTALKSKGSYFQFNETISPDDAKDLWNFQIGGYQVLHKWLYDRKGRVLTSEDIAHYQRVVVALSLTRSLMDEIDEVIAEYGGFPLVGSIDPSPLAPRPPSAEGNTTDDNLNDEDKDMTDQTFDELNPPLEPELTMKVLETSLANTAGVEYEDAGNGDSDLQPFDPSQEFRMTSQVMALETVVKRIRTGVINLKPDFQRMGGIWDSLKMSRLIKSLIIRIPLPAFYMDATDDSETVQWLVIDGLQRLTTLKRFMIPENQEERLQLKNMEFWKEFNDKYWEDLPSHLQRRIEDTQITIYLVEKGTPANVKFNIFKRINTGGMPLVGQEIRHALNQGAATLLLQELAETREFKTATQNGVSPMRMTDRECVLRFLAFTMKDYSEYTTKDELDSFLNERMREINQMGKNEPHRLDDLRARFKKAMKRSEELLRENAFRKPPKNNRRSPISKALFEVWSVNLERLTDEQFKNLLGKRGKLEKKFAALMKDQEFDVAISYSTGGASRVQTRFGQIAKIIEDTLTNA